MPAIARSISVFLCVLCALCVEIFFFRVTSEEDFHHTENTEKACPFVNRSYLQQLDALHNHWSFSQVPRLLFLNERPKHIPPHTRAEELCPNPVYLSRALAVCIKNAQLVDSEIRCLIRSRGIQSFLSKTPG